MAAFSTLLAGSLVAAGALAFVGLNTVRESRAGRRVSTVTDPAAPGFEALVEPTPTLGVLHVGSAGLISVAVLAAQTGDVGGSVVVVPPRIPSSLAPGSVPVDVIVAFADDQVDGVRAVQSALGIGIEEAVVIDDARWAELLGPVAPLSIQNPDELPGFPSGLVELGPEDVGPWLAARREGEGDLSRMFRQELFWRAWIEAVRASGDEGAVPGEVDIGIGRFVRALAAGPSQVATLPVRESVGFDGDTRLAIVADAADDLLSALVPFPSASSPGSRTRVRLLTGVGDAEQVTRVAPVLVRSQSQIVVAGNADRFDYEQSVIRYHAPEGRAAAERLRDALNAGQVVEDVRPTDAFDVTIVLGDDL